MSLQQRKVELSNQNDFFFLKFLTVNFIFQKQIVFFFFKRLLKPDTQL